MFENKLIKGIHMSRYVASWTKVGGELTNRSAWRFQKWLRTLEIDDEKLTEEDVMDIYNYATCGKLELQISAKKWLKDNP